MPFDGSASLFRVRVEDHRLGLAYEYAPYFSISVAWVDTLPHELEAVYDYLLKHLRIRFLVADDPRSAKTITTGMLVKELKAGGVVQRTFIVAPAIGSDSRRPSASHRSSLSSASPTSIWGRWPVPVLHQDETGGIVPESTAARSF